MAKKTSPIMLVITTALILIVVGGALVFTGVLKMPQEQVGGTATSGGIIAVEGSCPSTLTTTFQPSIQNPMNTSGVELFNVTAYIVSADGSSKSVTVGDGTASTTLSCGDTVTMKIISVDGAAGDSSTIVSSNIAGAKLDNGFLTFKVSGSSMTPVIKLRQRGVPEVRAYDNINGAYMYDTSDATNTDYETTDGILFTSTTDNATNYTVGEAGKLDVTQYVRANLADNNFNDRGILVLVDAQSSVWDNPSVKIDGSVATNIKDQLDSNERIAYSDYEYVYLISADRVIDNNNEIAVRITVNALGGVNPDGTDTINVDYAVRGAYASTSNANTVLTGAVKDDSSKTQVNTLHDTSLLIA